MITAPESAILLSLQQVGVSAGGWPEVLRLLASYVQADQVQLFTPSRGWDQTGALAVPMPAILTGLRLRRVYTGAELMDRAPAFGGVAEAADHRAIGLRLSDGVGWLVALRQRGMFRAVDSATLTALLPHLEQAWRIAAQIADLSDQAARSDAMARRIGVGYVDFDARGLPVARDGVARDLLARMHQVPVLPRSMGQTAILSIPPDLDMLCQRKPDGCVEGVLRASVHALPKAEVLAEALHLTVSEARLVRALAQGASLSEAAQALGLTLETARYYSKQVYAKTGLRGQPDLIRCIWTSALAFGSA